MRAWRIFWALLGALLVAWLGFHYAPAIDLGVSRFFYQGGDWLGGREPFAMLREIYYRPSILLGVYITLMALVSLKRETEVPKAFYRVFALMASLGVLVLVNWATKLYFGRARPYQVEEFGGDKLFTAAPFAPVHQCSGNCSFVSGEASGAMVLILSVVALFGGHKHRTFWIWLVLLPMAGMRVMAGKHFLSDVVLAMLLMSALYWGLLWWMKLTPADLRTSWGAFGRDFLGLFCRRR